MELSCFARRLTLLVVVTKVSQVSCQGYYEDDDYGDYGESSPDSQDDNGLDGNAVIGLVVAGVIAVVFIVSMYVCMKLYPMCKNDRFRNPRQEWEDDFDNKQLEELSNEFLPPQKTQFRSDMFAFNHLPFDNRNALTPEAPRQDWNNKLKDDKFLVDPLMDGANVQSFYPMNPMKSQQPFQPYTLSHKQPLPDLPPIPRFQLPKKSHVANGKIKMDDDQLETKAKKHPQLLSHAPHATTSRVVREFHSRHTPYENKLASLKAVNHFPHATEHRVKKSTGLATEYHNVSEKSPPKLDHDIDIDINIDDILHNSSPTLISKNNNSTSIVVTSENSNPTSVAKRASSKGGKTKRLKGISKLIQKVKSSRSTASNTSKKDRSRLFQQERKRKQLSYARKVLFHLSREYEKRRIEREREMFIAFRQRQLLLQQQQEQQQLRQFPRTPRRLRRLETH